MNSIGETKVCGDCGKPKTIHFFPPSQWALEIKSRRCSECLASKKPVVRSTLRERRKAWRDSNGIFFVH